MQPKRDRNRQAGSAVVEEFGVEVEDMGKAAAARAIEPLAMLWRIPGLTQNRWAHAFKPLEL